MKNIARIIRTTEIISGLAHKFWRFPAQHRPLSLQNFEHIGGRFNAPSDGNNQFFEFNLLVDRRKHRLTEHQFISRQKQGIDMGRGDKSINQFRSALNAVCNMEGESEWCEPRYADVSNNNILAKLTFKFKNSGGRQSQASANPCKVLPAIFSQLIENHRLLVRSGLHI
jgi:hypothetical protein